MPTITMYKIKCNKPNFFLGSYLVLFTLSFILCTSPVRAQSVSLSVSPPVVEILLSPNKAVEQTFHLDTSGSDLLVTPELHLAKPTGLSGHMSIDPNPLVQSTLPLSYKISGPSTSPTLTLEAASSDISQDVYLALVFKVTNKDEIISNTTSIPAISALILVTITKDGVLPINLEIENFETPIIHDSFTAFTLNPNLKNTTPIMIRPSGKFEIVSWSGKSQLAVDLYPNLILGNTTRSVFLSTSDSNPSPIPLQWSPKWSNIGPHKVRLTITTQGGTKLIETEKVVWLFPIRIFLICLLLGIFIFRLTSPKQNLRVNS